MSNYTFFSPSYIGDLDRMVWLRRSIDAFHDGEATHFIAVPKRDLPAFKKALGHQNHVEFVCQEDLVDRRFYPDYIYKLTKMLMPGQAWRLQSHAGKPGWIIQQVVKLASNQLVREGAIVFLDSDMFFYRPFAVEEDLGIRSGARVLVRVLPEEEGAKHRHHIKNSRILLGLAEGPTETTYMGYPVIWYTDWLTQLQNHIQQITGQSWQQALRDVDFSISEYTIYGVFIDEILKPENLTIRDEPFNLIAWDRASFEALKTDVMNGRHLPASRLTLCVQSNIGINVAEYEDMLRAILNTRSAVQA